MVCIIIPQFRKNVFEVNFSRKYPSMDYSSKCDMNRIKKYSLGRTCRDPLIKCLILFALCNITLKFLLEDVAQIKK